MKRAGNGAAPPVMYHSIAETAFGPMLVAGDGKRLAAIKFGVNEATAADAVAELRHETRGAFDFQRSQRRTAALVRQVREYLEGRRTAWDVELELSYVSGFRRDVLLETCAIPRGQIATYGEIARRAGSPRACRAVGNTMRTNPIPLVIPCHRVVGTNGSLTGFGGGLDMKRRLLELEGALLG